MSWLGLLKEYSLILPFVTFLLGIVTGTLTRVEKIAFWAIDRWQKRRRVKFELVVHTKKSWDAMAQNPEWKPENSTLVVNAINVGRQVVFTRFQVSAETTEGRKVLEAGAWSVALPAAISTNGIVFQHYHFDYVPEEKWNNLELGIELRTSCGKTFRLNGSKLVEAMEFRS